MRFLQENTKSLTVTSQIDLRSIPTNRKEKQQQHKKEAESIEESLVLTEIKR